MGISGVGGGGITALQLDSLSLLEKGILRLSQMADLKNLEGSARMGVVEGRCSCCGVKNACEERTILSTEMPAVPEVWRIFFFFFFKDFIYLFLEGGEGREKERERNIEWLPLAHPQQGT